MYFTGGLQEEERKMSVVWKLFIVFLRIGLFSIGGGYAIIPSIQEQVVEKTGWISEKMFTDIITISQMTPGPLAVNTSTFVGLQIGGIAGLWRRRSAVCCAESSFRWGCIVFSDTPAVRLCAGSAERAEIRFSGADHIGGIYDHTAGVVRQS